MIVSIIINKIWWSFTSIDGDKVDMIRRLTGNLAVLSAMNSQAFNSILTTLEDRSSVFSKILDGNPVAGATQRASVGDRTADKKRVGNTCT
jgi:hypothetical protein